MKRDLTVFLFLFLLLFPGECKVLGDNEPDVLSHGNRGFKENKGQIIDQNNKPDPAVLYLLNTPGFNVHLRRNGFSYDIYEIRDSIQGKRQEATGNRIIQHSASGIEYHRIDIEILNRNPQCTIIPSDSLLCKLNYYGEFAPVNGITNIHQFEKIIYKNIYPKIDLVFMTGQETEYKYNFIIHPGGKISDIRLKISEPDKIAFKPDKLSFCSSIGELYEFIPESYINILNDKIHVIVYFRKIKQDIIGFSLDTIIPENALLVIDPTLSRMWGTYFGGSNLEMCQSSVLDANGNIFICGETASTDNIATSGAYQTTMLGINTRGFLSKFSPDGVQQWGTYYEGSLSLIHI